ncbi:MAG TPA: hypothetical protein VMB20_00845 [Candidatus Acidoferrum sp.]|nr:hypothetical protein [Candidatus Acidoferrum sp.]
MATTGQQRDAYIESLLVAKAALQGEIDIRWKIVGDEIAGINAMEADIKNLDEMLARAGYKAPPAVAEQRVLIAAEEQSQKPSLDEIVAKMVIDSGTSEAARNYCEWLIRTEQLPNPSPVRAFFDAFTPSLRQQYNADRALAIEALRAQIRSWHSKAITWLRYEGGEVGGTPPKAQEKETA